MTEPMLGRTGSLARPAGGGTNLADVLERVLDTGIVIAGDIRINLLDIELLTIRLRLVVASVDKAKEMGIDWWERDASLSSRAVEPRTRAEPVGSNDRAAVEDGGVDDGLAEENRRLRQRLAELEAASGSPEPASPASNGQVRGEVIHEGDGAPARAEVREGRGGDHD